MKFYTLFLKTENVHLMKDVGQIPICLKRNFGYETFLVTYRNGEYPYLLNEAQGLKMQFVNQSILGKIVDGICFMWKNRKTIDVLNVYHLNLSSFIWVLFFGTVKKKGALVYLKLDANYMEIEKVQSKSLRALVKRITLRKADIISAESTIIKESFQKYSKTEILYIPNGYLLTQVHGEEAVDCKKNIILTVGRLGTYPKATELLVEAFIHAEISLQWKLVLIGTVEERFSKWLEQKMEKYPMMRGRILMPGLIEDKGILREWYRGAKIFVLPSRWESFGIVLIEALLSGDYLIASDAVLAAKDLIQTSDMGTIFSSGSMEELKKALEETTTLDIDWNENAKRIIKNVEGKFSWESILQTLDQRISAMWSG